MKKRALILVVLCLLAVFILKKGGGGFYEMNAKAVEALMKYPAAMEVFSFDAFEVTDA